MDVKNYIMQKGFTLVELMVSVTVGMIVVAGVTSVYVSAMVSSSDTLKNSKLNQELSTLMSVMTSDIMRSGYTASTNYSSPQSNIFNQVNNTALEVHASNVEVAANSATGGDCIVYTYDADLGNDLDNNEIYGFRLNDSAVELRSLGDASSGDQDNCNNSTDDTWTAATDKRLITITALNFALDGSACLNTREPDLVDNDGDAVIDNAEEMDCYATAPVASSGDITVETRQVDITLSGRLANDATVTATLTQSVRVRNDLVRIR